ncbi:MAG: hypothetical protein PHR14_03010 [Oscillospiraceae bacterium]|nr:hypothetical protein [Oscillospiraceae bacterium]
MVSVLRASSGSPKARHAHFVFSPGKVYHITAFEILTIQTDNGTEFTYKFISDDKLCPFEEELKRLGINHKLIKPRTPWHNGKVERSHRMDQRCFYEY